MLKTPKPLWKKSIKRGATVLFVIEAALFVGSYGIWYRLNTERDFRLYMHKNYPSILNSYYNIGEYFGDNKVRQLDKTVWVQEGKD